MTKWNFEIKSELESSESKLNTIVIIILNNQRIENLMKMLKMQNQEMLQRFEKASKA